MEFKKIDNRYEKTPVERVKLVMKKYKRMSITKLYTMTHIQYHTLEKLLDGLRKEGLVMIKRHTINGLDNSPVYKSVDIIWKVK